LPSLQSLTEQERNVAKLKERLSKKKLSDVSKPTHKRNNTNN